MKVIFFFFFLFCTSLYSQHHDVQWYIDDYDAEDSTTWDWDFYLAPDTMYIDCHLTYEDSTGFYESKGFGYSERLYIMNANNWENYPYRYSIEVLCSNDYDDLDGIPDFFIKWCDCETCYNAGYEIWDVPWISNARDFSNFSDCNFTLDYGGTHGTEIDFETQIKVKVYSSDDDTQVFDELVLVFYMGDNSCDSPTQNENNTTEDKISLQYLSGEKVIQYSKMTAINGMQYRLINQMGMVVQIGNLDNVEGVIDVSECHAGWYIVEIFDTMGQAQKTQKFIFY